ncbi:MAG: hypothetical protein R3A46_08130 [Thermomicrobiales bacterium]
MRLLRLLWVALIVAGGSALTLVPAAAVEIGDDYFANTWSRTDLPVANSEATRTWMWGPAAFTSAMEEWYEEGVGNARVVQYFDKTRMEISTDPTADPSSIWYVTNGLLARELVTGELQMGDNDFLSLEPADVNVAGDADDQNGPMYSSFVDILGDDPLQEGTIITQRIHRDGSATNDPSLFDQNVAATHFVPETNHTVAGPFWSFMNSTGTVYENGQYVDGQMFQNPFFATGLPISEAYWADVKVGGVQQLVLIQVFERRVLTYTPANPAEWQVEAGNVGQHYYRWRYLTDIPTEPPAVTSGDHEQLGPNFLPTWPVDYDGQAMVSFGNQAPYQMTVQLDGPVSRTVTIPPCDSCQVYPITAPPSSCIDEIPWHDEFLPPGNYRVQISWNGSQTSMLAGPQTYVPDAGYGTCFFILEGL